MMMRTGLAALWLVAMALAWPAAAHDAATCKRVLTGAWTGTTERVISGQSATVTTVSLYKAEGRFASIFSIQVKDAPEGARPIEQHMEGTWDTRAGPSSDSCEAVLTPMGASPISMVLTLVDDDTVRTAQGNVSTRVKQ